MAYRIIGRDGQPITPQDLNLIAQAVGGNATFGAGQQVTAASLNAITQGVASPGVLVNTGTECMVSHLTGGDYQVAPGQVVFGNGAVLTNGDSTPITRTNLEGEGWVYAQLDLDDPTLPPIVLSTTPMTPTANRAYCLLATIATDGTVTDARPYARLVPATTGTHANNLYFRVAGYQLQTNGSPVTIPIPVPGTFRYVFFSNSGKFQTWLSPEQTGGGGWVKDEDSGEQVYLSLQLNEGAVVLSADRAIRTTLDLILV